MEVNTKANFALLNAIAYCKANLIDRNTAFTGTSIPIGIKNNLTQAGITLETMSKMLSTQTKLTDITASNVNQCTPERKIMIMIHLLSIDKGIQLPLVEEDFRNNVIKNYTNSKLDVDFSLSKGTIANLVVKVLSFLSGEKTHNQFLLSACFDKMKELIQDMTPDSEEVNRHIAGKLIANKIKSPRRDDFILYFDFRVTDSNHVWTVKNVIPKGGKNPLPKFCKVKIEDRSIVEYHDNLPVDADKTFLDTKTIVMMPKPIKEINYEILFKSDFAKFKSQDNGKTKDDALLKQFMENVFKPVIIVNLPGIVKAEEMKNQVKFLKRYGEDIMVTFWSKVIIDETKKEISKVELGKKLKASGHKPFSRNYDQLMEYSKSLKNFKQ